MKRLLFVIVCLGALRAYGQSDIINNSYYGVPSSPAFELLPDKPSEVTHILTPKDFTSFAPLVLDGSSLKANVGFDFRPGSSFVGSLKDYRESKTKQILWRTVLSGGTAAIKDSEDQYLAFGLRIPIIDRGDPRADETFVRALETETTRVDSVQPDFPESPDDLTRIDPALSKRLEKLRKEFVENNWNKFRLDVGFGNLFLLQSARLKQDSIRQDRFGMWTAASIPLGKKGQLMVSAKNAWIMSKSEEDETSRTSAGARVRFFLTSVALSVEYAKIWSTYKDAESLSEDWNHFAALLEIPVSRLNGVIGIAYGGDSSRRSDADAKFEFRYSFYTDKLIKKD